MADDAPLEKALQELQQAWTETAEGWRDHAREEFGRLHLDPIISRTREAARTLRELTALVEEARRACR